MDQQWREAMGEGALLILVGMLVVFVGLATLVLAIMIMNRLFPDKGQKTERPASPESMVAETSEREKVAALAVAVVKAMEEEREAVAERSTVNAAGASGETSRWAGAGREQAMRSRGKAGRQWGRRSD